MVNIWLIYVNIWLIYIYMVNDDGYYMVNIWLIMVNWLVVDLPL